MTRVLVLRTGQAVNRVHAHCGPFYRLFERGLNADAPAERIAVDELDVTCRRPGDGMPSLARYHGAIMTGSPAFVGDGEAWMAWGEELLRFLLGRDLPLLCICFGHQLLGSSLGSEVGPNPTGREMGTIDVEIEPEPDDVLLGALPRRFEAQCTHRDVIRGPGAKLKVLGRAPHDRHHVVRAGRRAWGLQFHPEFDDVIMRLYLEVRRDSLDDELGAGSCDRRIARVRPTPEAGSILTRFAEVCRDEARARERDGGSLHGA
jgi:GMP synthase (glutamine-hydrolysing)